MRKREKKTVIGGWAGWLFGKLNGQKRREPRLHLLERIALAPRQTLALIEADGRRLLVATSADGGSAFYPLDERAAQTARGTVRDRQLRAASESSARVSW